MNPTSKRTNQKGFTLVELAIVLVIIGLIVGGVLVGQDLIKAAEIRATISQLEKLNTAVNTFRGKYNGLPGDSATGATFLTGCTNGDGNGLLTDTLNTVANADTDFDAPTAELLNTFACLSSAGMVDGSYNNTAAGAGNEVGTGANFPATKLGRHGILAHAISGRNQWHMGVTNATAAATAFGAALSPNEALQIDTKMDDATPNSGSVLAFEGATAAAIVGAQTSADNHCTMTASTYNVAAAQADADTVLCQIRARWN